MVGEPLRLSDMPRVSAGGGGRGRGPAVLVAITGIDLIGIARAACGQPAAPGAWCRAARRITQQVAKNLFLTNARTFRRKVQELMLTLWLERSFSKREILEIWLNRVYLGSGAWGVDAAARLYFGVSARTSEPVAGGGARRAAARAVALQPARRPGRRRRARARGAGGDGRRPARSRAAEAAARARAQIAFPPRPAIAAGWFADWVAEQAQALLPPRRRRRAAHHARPAAAGAWPRRGWPRCWTGRARRPGSGRARSSCWTPRAARCARWSAGATTRRAPSTARCAARRQPGSAFKPFVWLAALENGVRPDDTVLDAPIRIGSWSPANFERRYRGEVTLEEALAQSLNTASVRLLHRRPAARARSAAVARRLGIADPLPDNASLALGTGEVGVLELAAAYAAFFNGGMRVAPYRDRERSKRTAARLAVPRDRRERRDRPRSGGDDGAHAGRRRARAAAAGRRRSPGGSSPARPAPRRITATPGSSAAWTAR